MFGGSGLLCAVRIFMIWALGWLPSDFRCANDISADILELHPLFKVMTDNELNFYNSNFAS